MNFLTYFQRSTKADDWSNKVAIGCLVLATAFGFSSGTNHSLITTGTTATYRTKREESEEGLQDNDLSEPTPLLPVNDTIVIKSKSRTVRTHGIKIIGGGSTLEYKSTYPQGSVSRYQELAY